MAAKQSKGKQQYIRPPKKVKQELFSRIRSKTRESEKFQLHVEKIVRYTYTHHIFVDIYSAFER